MSCNYGSLPRPLLKDAQLQIAFIEDYYKIAAKYVYDIADKVDGKSPPVAVYVFMPGRHKMSCSELGFLADTAMRQEFAGNIHEVHKYIRTTGAL